MGLWCKVLQAWGKRIKIFEIALDKNPQIWVGAASGIWGGFLGVLEVVIWASLASWGHHRHVRGTGEGQWVLELPAYIYFSDCTCLGGLSAWCDTEPSLCDVMTKKIATGGNCHWREMNPGAREGFACTKGLIRGLHCCPNHSCLSMIHYYHI